MTYRTKIESATKLVVLAVLAMNVGAASAAEFNLRADTTVITMPDGTDVPMWGFACESAVPPAVCPNPSVVTVPGPALSVPAGDGTLVINLLNDLPAPISLVIPGQAAQMTPVWTDGTSGPRTSLGQRVRSFTHEAAANGGTATYVWNGVRPGTFLYHSGTHPQVQVQMGLYGAITKQAGAGLAYDGVAFDRERVLLFSEVDPALHAAVAGGTYGGSGYPSTIGYRPRYFLVNGAPYSPANACLGGAVSTGDAVLLRMLNAGLRELAPMILEAHWDVVAEGGSPYRVTTGGADVPHAKQQYSVLLAPGGTADVVFTPQAAGRYMMLDRRLNLSNAGQPDGGFQRCLVAAGASTPQPSASVFPLELTFPKQPLNTPSAARTVTLSNTGEGALSLSGIAIGGTNAADFAQTNSCGSTVPAGTSCAIQVTFTPRASGSRVATLTIAGNDPVHPVLAVPLSYTVTPATGLSVAASPAGPYAPGQTGVTFTATATGSLTNGVATPAADYEYKFQFWNGTQWTTVKPYNVPGNTWVMTAPMTPGSYRLYVETRTTTNVGSDTFARHSFTVSNPAAPTPATSLTVTATPTGPYAPGQPGITFTATGDGSTTNGVPTAASVYQYKFQLWDGTAWTVVKPYSVPGNTYTTSAPTAPGQYRLYVEVRTTSTVGSDTFARHDFTVRDPAATPTPATGLTVSANPGSPYAPGQTGIVVTATGSGSTTSGAPTPESVYQYKFQLWNGTQWTVVKPYTTPGNTYVLTAPATPGSYRFYVEVRTTSFVGSDTFARHDFTVQAP